MIVYCDKKECIYRKNGQCTLKYLYYENTICVSFCSRNNFQQKTYITMPYSLSKPIHIKTNLPSIIK